MDSTAYTLRWRVEAAMHMSLGKPSFADCTVVKDLITEIPGEGGKSHHGDGMCGPTVVWLANTPPGNIRKAKDLMEGANRSDARALHDCARRWLAENHPELLEDSRPRLTPCHRALERASQRVRAALASHVAWLRRTPAFLRSGARRVVATAKPCAVVSASP